MNDRQIVSAQEMRQLDKLSINHREITSYQLMTEAGTTCYQYIYDFQLVDFNGLFVVIAGTGNNGGDALVIAKRLLQQDANVVVISIGTETQFTEERAQALADLKALNPKVISLMNTDQLDEAMDWIDQATTIIDGIFGIGLSRNVEGLYVPIIERINRSYANTISIDIPSGIKSDNGLVQGIAVEANHTLVIQNYKQGNLLNDGLDYCGQLHLLDVGIMQMLFPEEQVLLDKQYLKHKIPPRKHNSYKYMFGNVITIGGSKGMMGAPLLSAHTALRMGSGLSHLLYHEKYRKHAHNPYPDIMMNTYDGIEEIPSLVRKKSAVIFGPGLGQKDKHNLEVLSYLVSTDIPLVIDADGIYYLKQILSDYSNRPNIVITPHYKEMSDFLGIPIEEVQKEPVLYAKNIAHTYNVTVVLKGACTIITNNQSTFFSIHGNPGLATAGTGDVLSGIIGNLLGRGMHPMRAAKTGVLMHSLAGELAKEQYGEESMIASDLIEMIPKVMRYATR